MDQGTSNTHGRDSWSIGQAWFMSFNGSLFRRTIKTIRTKMTLVHRLIRETGDLGTNQYTLKPIGGSQFFDGKSRYRETHMILKAKTVAS